MLCAMMQLYRCVLVQNHIKEECQLVKFLCPIEGCSEEITRPQLDDHLQQCQYRRQSCYWCKKEIRCDQQKVFTLTTLKL